ncbi:hypothetical protein, partial [Mesorhizobium sp.]
MSYLNGRHASKQRRKAASDRTHFGASASAWLRSTILSDDNGRQIRGSRRLPTSHRQALSSIIAGVLSMNDFDGKVALVTGTTGIAEATA